MTNYHRAMYIKIQLMLEKPLFCFSAFRLFQFAGGASRTAYRLSLSYSVIFLCDSIFYWYVFNFSPGLRLIIYKLAVVWKLWQLVGDFALDSHCVSANAVYLSDSWPQSGGAHDIEVAQSTIVKDLIMKPSFVTYFKEKQTPLQFESLQ